MRGQALQEQCMLNIHTAWSQRTADLPSTPCRTDREKEAGGVPDIPTPGRLVELEYAAISDRKMRGQLRNPADIEKTVSPCLPQPLPGGHGLL